MSSWWKAFPWNEGPRIDKPLDHIPLGVRAPDRGAAPDPGKRCPVDWSEKKFRLSGCGHQWPSSALPRSRPTWVRVRSRSHGMRRPPKSTGSISKSAIAARIAMTQVILQTQSAMTCSSSRQPAERAHRCLYRGIVVFGSSSARNSSFFALSSTVNHAVPEATHRSRARPGTRPIRLNSVRGYLIEQISAHEMNQQNRPPPPAFVTGSTTARNFSIHQLLELLQFRGRRRGGAGGRSLSI